jgi:hypothetical protein
MHVCRSAALIVAGAALSSFSCRPLPPLPPPPAASSAVLSSEDLPAESRVELAISDMREIVSEDQVEVVVTGQVVNRGTRPTTSVLVEVSALDRNGFTLHAARVAPITGRIPPQGGSARFSVVFPNDPAVVAYHIEAIGYGRKIAE